MPSGGPCGPQRASKQLGERGPEPTEAPGRGPQGPLPGACRKGGSQTGLGVACWAAGTASSFRGEVPRLSMMVMTRPRMLFSVVR